MAVTREECLAAFRAALVSRGPRKGILLANCPRGDTDAAAAWQAIMLRSNPFKVGIGTVLFMSERQREIFNFIGETVDSHRLDVRGLDRDRRALEALGAW